MRYASTDQLLFMNGCDHQPVQTDLSSAIRTANALYPDVEFVHSNFTDYVEQVKGTAGRSEHDHGRAAQPENGWMVYVSEHSILPHLYQTVECPL